MPHVSRTALLLAGLVLAVVVAGADQQRAAPVSGSDRSSDAGETTAQTASERVRRPTAQRRAPQAESKVSADRAVSFPADI